MAKKVKALISPKKRPRSNVAPVSLIPVHCNNKKCGVNFWRHPKTLEENKKCGVCLEGQVVEGHNPKAPKRVRIRNNR